MFSTLKTLLWGFLVGATLINATLQQDEAVNPIHWSLKLTTAQKTYQKGEPFTVQLQAQIEDGWHLYALEEIPNGPRPTRILLPDEQAFAFAGELGQPMPISKFDENFGVETQFYEKAVTFRVPLKIADTAQPGVTKLVLQVRYQTCNDTLCLPPKTVKLETVVEIK